eukprot:gene290-163_t
MVHHAFPRGVAWDTSRPLCDGDKRCCTGCYTCCAFMRVWASKPPRIYTQRQMETDELTEIQLRRPSMWVIMHQNTALSPTAMIQTLSLEHVGHWRSVLHCFSLTLISFLQLHLYFYRSIGRERSNRLAADSHRVNLVVAMLRRASLVLPATRRLVAPCPRLQPGTIFSARRHFSALFEEEHRRSGGAAQDSAVAVFKINADYLDKSKAIVDRKAYGVPFHLVEEMEVLERVRRHHGSAVAIRHIERLLVPFWLTRTAAGGYFTAELLQKDPSMMTQPHCFVWVEGPRYEFSYPFEEYLPLNQTCACYTEPLSLVEACVCGSHIPSMLISRFELLQGLEETMKAEAAAHRRTPLKVIPFAMSTSTALAVVERRVNRHVVMNRIDMELKKFHGNFLKSNVTINAISLHATNIRPVFLPLYKVEVNTASSSTAVPTYVCGATGKTAGPVVGVSPKERAVYMSGAAATAFLSLALTASPAVAATGAFAAAVGALSGVQFYRALRLRQQQAQWTAELKQASVLNLPSDSSGYRWTVDDEERQEYEYREHLRQQARQKVAFQQRVKEESSKEQARKFGRHIDARRRRRTDLQHADPLGYYRILGLQGKEGTATAKEITSAFRRAARIHHPDVRGHQQAEGAAQEEEEEKAKRYMQRLLEAYKVLHSETSRRAYDSGRTRDGPGSS